MAVDRAVRDVIHALHRSRRSGTAVGGGSPQASATTSPVCRARCRSEVTTASTRRSPHVIASARAWRSPSPDSGGSA